jgi:SAM-dependent methyltransferase
MASTEQALTLRPSKNFEYYKGSIYWNNFEAVQECINYAISGNAGKNWIQHLRDRYGHFRDTLVVNCGNGWVERDLFRAGLIDTVFGFDISEALIEEAAEHAKSISMPFVYEVGDANNIDLDDVKAQLVVNHGAMHHVAYIDRLTRQLCRVLANCGTYIGFDYTGPHRNQYSWEAWSSMVKLNASLPERFQMTLIYPHLRTMLATDPTEAVHSELQVGILERYFDTDQFVPLGGAIAYQLLYQNIRLYEERHTTDGQAVIQRILDADRSFLAAHPRSSLFSFWVASPKNLAQHDENTLKRWEQEENMRERMAAENGGLYYDSTALEIIYNKIAS